MRAINDFSRVIREGAWIGGCVVAAFLVGKFVEDKGHQTPFLTTIFYLGCGAIRLLYWCGSRFRFTPRR